MTARPRARLRRRLALLALAIALALAIDAFLIEPYRLEVTHHQRSNAVRTQLRIAHLSDLHTAGLGRRERSLLEQLDAERPDLIVITGDTVDSGRLEAARPVLAAMHAPLGVFAVHGNWEHWRPVSDAAAFYQSTGAHLLRNEAVMLRDDVWLVGLDDALAGTPDEARAWANVPRGANAIAIFHSPVGVDRIEGRAALAFAGHTHGGQVRLPFVGALWLPPGSGPYVGGWYQRGCTELYVSRGIGTSMLPVRFWCRPELAVIDVVPPPR